MRFGESIGDISIKAKLSIISVSLDNITIWLKSSYEFCWNRMQNLYLVPNASWDYIILNLDQFHKFSKRLEFYRSNLRLNCLYINSDKFSKTGLIIILISALYSRIFSSKWPNLEIQDFCQGEFRKFPTQIFHKRLWLLADIAKMSPTS